MSEKEIEGWEVKKVANQIELYSPGSDGSGINITVNKKKKTFHISGWYDSYAGIQGGEISLEALQKLINN